MIGGKTQQAESESANVGDSDFVLDDQRLTRQTSPNSTSGSTAGSVDDKRKRWKQHFHMVLNCSELVITHD